jgi:hypothetical protein
MFKLPYFQNKGKSCLEDPEKNLYSEFKSKLGSSNSYEYGFTDPSGCELDPDLQS